MATGEVPMSYETGLPKYIVAMIFCNPLNMYIYGGSLLWILDVFQLVGSDSVNEFAWNYVLMEYGLPSSIGDAFLQIFIGAVVAGAGWYVGSTRYAQSQGWR
jgi:hypothetical protein